MIQLLNVTNLSICFSHPSTSTYSTYSNLIPKLLIHPRIQWMLICGLGALAALSCLEFTWFKRNHYYRSATGCMEDMMRYAEIWSWWSAVTLLWMWYDHLCSMHTGDHIHMSYNIDISISLSLYLKLKSHLYVCDSDEYEYIWWVGVSFVLCNSEIYAYLPKLNGHRWCTFCRDYFVKCFQQCEQARAAKLERWHKLKRIVADLDGVRKAHEGPQVEMNSRCTCWQFRIQFLQTFWDFDTSNVNSQDTSAWA